MGGVHIPTGGVSRARSKFSHRSGSLPSGKTLDAFWCWAGQDVTFLTCSLKEVINRTKRRDVNLCFEVEATCERRAVPRQQLCRLSRRRRYCVMYYLYDYGVYCFYRCNRSTRGLEYTERRVPEPGLKPRGNDKRATDRADGRWHHYSKSLARCGSREQQRSKHHNSRSHSVNTHNHFQNPAKVKILWVFSVIWFVF